MKPRTHDLGGLHIRNLTRKYIKYSSKILNPVKENSNESMDIAESIADIIKTENKARYQQMIHPKKNKVQS